jgi:hypothetical protein
MSHEDENDDGLPWQAIATSKSPYLNNEMLPVDGVTVRIVGANVDEVTDPEDRQRKVAKIALALEEADTGAPMKAWIPCPTTFRVMTALFGTNLTRRWVGHLLTIHRDPKVKVGNKVTGGIRVLGSPELQKPMPLEIKAGRAPVYRVTLRPTGRGPAPAPSPAPAPRPPTLEDLGLTRAGVDALLQEKGRPAADDSNLGAILSRLAHPDSAAALARARELSHPATAADDAANTLPDLE